MTTLVHRHQLVGSVDLGLEAPGAAGAFVPAPAWRQPPQAELVALPRLAGSSDLEIRERVRRIVAMHVPDDSGSMYCSAPYGDAEGARYAAAKSVNRFLSREGGGRVGVVHWGTHAPAELVLRPVDVKKAKRALDRALRIPNPTLGGNDLPAALRRTAEILPPLDSDDIPVIFVETDGIEMVTPATHAAVAALPANSVHLLLVDRGNGCTPEMEADWKSVAFGSFTRLSSFDTKAMATEIAQIIAAALGLHLASPTEPATSTGRKK